VHEVVDDKSNPYRNIVIYAMRMNKGYVVQFPVVNEEPKVNTTRFFDLLKDSDELL
jgi:hypothetical protein